MKALLLVLVLLVAGCSSPSPSSEPRLTIAQGELRGVADGDVTAFHNVPYAAPPVGPLRWAPPRPPASWAGERDETAPGSRCPQPDPSGKVSGAEDCLTLSVHRPASGDKRPVLLWIHG